MRRPDGDERVWEVELRAQVGPLARFEAIADGPNRARAESPSCSERRKEVDGRTHSPWILESTLVASRADSVELTMVLTYGGNLWTGAVLEQVLDDHVERGAVKLSALLADRGRPVD